MALRELIRPKINRPRIGKPLKPQALQVPISPQSEDGKRVSKEVYWAEYYEHPDFVYEWNNGILEVKPMAKIVQSDMYQWFFYLLKMYLRVHPIAKLVMLEIGFELPLNEGERVRIPDLGVVRHDNPIPAGPEDHKYKGTFDLCIESLSDSNARQIQRDVKTKRAEYAQVGVKEYFILDDRRDRHMAFYRLTPLGIYQSIKPTEEGVIRSSVLPGFQFRLEDLYLQPEVNDLVDDPVYMGFIWPEYLAEKGRADTAVEQANKAEEQIEVLQNQVESEKDRADAVARQMEELIAKLNELGIDPGSLDLSTGQLGK